jgi:peptide/nickel transport system permease protein
VLAYAVRRLAQIVPVLLFASGVIFLMIYLVPGDPAFAILGPDARPEQVAAIRQQMGLDQPLLAQYVRWLGRVARGDLGVSFLNSYPVWGLILLKLPATLALGVGGLVVALAISLPLGILSAVRRSPALDATASAFASLGLSVPTFWLGILLVLLFSLRLQWLPASGYVPFLEQPVVSLRHLVLPSLTLGIAISAILTRFVRSAMLEVIHQAYVQTARAKGVPEHRVVLRHALRNALIPVVTVLGVQFASLLGGAVIVETVFSWPGIGRLAVNAIWRRDYPVITGTTLVFAVVFVLTNLVVDVMYTVIDPRVRYD